MRRPLAFRFALFSLAVAAASVALAFVLNTWMSSALWAGGLALLVMAPVALFAAWRQLAPMLSLFRALGATVGSYRDGDFSFSLSWDRRDELRDLVAAHNALGASLREQRLTLVERELLLDTMVQHTPVAMVLTDPAQRIAYANVAARKLLGRGRRLENRSLSSLIEGAAPALRDSIERGGDGIVTVPQQDDRGEGDDDEETYHLARRRFRLNGRAHELFLIRRLTAELRRQEVRTWKKVIRVISHELNNSLAPIVSLAHSGGQLVAQGRTDELAPVFEIIEERARHLDQFIRGYAHFAKLPAPQLAPVQWPAFVGRLRSQVSFEVAGSLPETSSRFDASQVEQALINLLKNAHESGSPPAAVSLRVRRVPGKLRIEVADRGSGMGDAVLASALVPFYSTKRSGTGLGLALAREISEAHGGRVSLARREGGGLVVALILPEE